MTTCGRAAVDGTSPMQSKDGVAGDSEVARLGRHVALRTSGLCAAATQTDDEIRARIGGGGVQARFVAELAAIQIVSVLWVVMQQPPKPTWRTRAAR